MLSTPFFSALHFVHIDSKSQLERLGKPDESFTGSNKKSKWYVIRLLHVMCTINVCPSCIPVIKYAQKLRNLQCASNNELFVNRSLGGNEKPSSVLSDRDTCCKI